MARKPSKSAGRKPVPKIRIRKRQVGQVLFARGGTGTVSLFETMKRPDSFKGAPPERIYSRKLPSGRTKSVYKDRRISRSKWVKGKGKDSRRIKLGTIKDRKNP